MVIITIVVVIIIIIIIIIIVIAIIIVIVIRLEVVGTRPLKVLDICSVALLLVAVITTIISSIILININTTFTCTVLQLYVLNSTHIKQPRTKTISLMEVDVCHLKPFFMI